MGSPMTPKTLWKRGESNGKAESLGMETGRPLDVQPGSPKHDYNTQELGTGTRGRQNFKTLLLANGRICSWRDGRSYWKKY